MTKSGHEDFKCRRHKTTLANQDGQQALRDVGHDVIRHVSVSLRVGRHADDAAIVTVGDVRFSKQLGVAEFMHHGDHDAVH